MSHERRIGKRLLRLVFFTGALLLVGLGFTSFLDALTGLRIKTTSGTIQAVLDVGLKARDGFRHSDNLRVSLHDRGYTLIGGTFKPAITFELLHVGREADVWYTEGPISGVQIVAITLYDEQDAHSTKYVTPFYTDPLHSRRIGLIAGGVCCLLGVGCVVVGLRPPPMRLRSRRLYSPGQIRQPHRMSHHHHQRQRQRHWH